MKNYTMKEIYQALINGLRNYLQENGFKKVIVGLSGGIDSIAVDAIGAENVTTVMLPSKYTSQISIDDAKETAGLLGAEHKEIRIEEINKSILNTLGFEGKTGIAEENIQARIRGLLLMALSNKYNMMLLATGNKSEASVGYCTLYGDTCGGYCVIGGVYKTTVFEISKFRNENFYEGWLGKEGQAIPERVITKAPSAELNENQKDSDSLPEYDILDKILIQLVDEKKSVDEVVGFDKDVVDKVAELYKKSEYKRLQSAPMTKIKK